MKAQVLYSAQNDGVISGSDMQEFFLQTKGEYSISGNCDISKKGAVSLMKNSLDTQERNSPSMAGWCGEMRKKYKL